MKSAHFATAALSLLLSGLTLSSGIAAEGNSTETATSSQTLLIPELNHRLPIPDGWHSEHHQTPNFNLYLLGNQKEKGVVSIMTVPLDAEMKASIQNNKPQYLLTSLQNAIAGFLDGIQTKPTSSEKPTLTANGNGASIKLEIPTASGPAHCFFLAFTNDKTHFVINSTYISEKSKAEIQTILKDIKTP